MRKTMIDMFRFETARLPTEYPFWEALRIYGGQLRVVLKVSIVSLFVFLTIVLLLSFRYPVNLIHMPWVWGSVGLLSVSLIVKRGRTQWLLAFLLTGLLPLAGMLTSWIFIIFLMTSILITVYISSYVIKPLFGNRSHNSFLGLVKLITGLWRGLHVVEGGKTVGPNGKLRVMGPTLMVVRPNNVVIMEGGKQQPRILLGPSVFITDRFEYVKEVFDLQPRQLSLLVTKCLTSDGIEMQVKVNSVAGLNVSLNSRQSGRLSPEESEYLTRIYWYLADWELQLDSAIHEAVRSSIAHYELNNLISKPPYDDLAANIRKRVNQNVAKWGIRTFDVLVEGVYPPVEFIRSYTEARAVATVEEIRAQASRDALITLADGYNAARELNTPEAVIHREVLSRTLRQIAQEPGVGALLSPELSAVLREMLESLRA